VVNALRNQFAGPTKEVIDTILVAQTQMKDGLLLASLEYAHWILNIFRWAFYVRAYQANRAASPVQYVVVPQNL